VVEAEMPVVAAEGQAGGRAPSMALQVALILALLAVPMGDHHQQELRRAAQVRPYPPVR